MPARTNLFQQVVATIYTHLGRHAVVTESKMLRDSRTGELREVDTCIEATVAGQSIVISVECRDHKRPQTVEWIDQMYGKHLHLPTNALVLVSSSGFTKSAISKAATYDLDIKTISPETDLADVGTAWGKQIKLYFSRNEIYVQSIVITLADDDGGMHSLQATPDIYVFDEAGEKVADVNLLVESATGQSEFRSEVTKRRGAHENGGDITFSLNVDLPTAHSLHIRRDDGHFQRMAEMVIRGCVRVTSTRAPFVHGKLSETRFSYASDGSDSISSTIVTTEMPDGTEGFTIITPEEKHTSWHTPNSEPDDRNR